MPSARNWREIGHAKIGRIQFSATGGPFMAEPSLPSALHHYVWSGLIISNGLSSAEKQITYWLQNAFFAKICTILVRTSHFWPGWSSLAQPMLIRWWQSIATRYMASLFHFSRFLEVQFFVLPRIWCRIQFQEELYFYFFLSSKFAGVLTKNGYQSRQTDSSTQPYIGILDQFYLDLFELVLYMYIFEIFVQNQQYQICTSEPLFA